MTMYPNFYFSESLFDIIFMLSKHHLILFLFMRIIIIYHDLHISELPFLLICPSPNCHVTEKLFDLKHIRPKNNGAKVKENFFFYLV